MMELQKCKAVKREGQAFPVIALPMLEDISMVAMPATTNSGSLTRELLQNRKITPKTVLEVSDIRSLFDAVERGIGSAICMNVPLGKRRLQYLTLEEMEPIEQVTNLVYRSDKNLNGAMKYLIHLITEHEQSV